MHEPSFQPTDTNTDPAARSSTGCAKKGLMGCAIFIVVSVLGALLTGYYVWYHTSLPIQGLVALLNQAPGVRIEGVSGSLSSGFEVKRIRITDDAGNVNELDDIRLKYRGQGEDFVITDIHVGRGYFYMDRSKDKDGDETVPDPATPGQGSPSNARYFIEKVSINDVTVEDVHSKEKFHLDQVELDGLVLGRESKIGKLIVKSPTCDLKVLPADGTTGDVLTINGRFEPGFHESMASAFDVQGEMDARGKDLDLRLLAGKVSLKEEGKKTSMRVKDLSLAEYFKEAPPLGHIELEVTRDEDSGKATGSFTIGDKTFVMDQKVPGTKDRRKEDLIARHESDGVAYEIRITVGAKSKQLFPPMRLTTKPAMSAEDAVAQLLTGKKYATLTGADKADVKKALGYFMAEAEQQLEERTEEPTSK